MNTQKLRTAEFTRNQLADMLLELSDDALEYIKLPILGAYYWTDQHDADRMTLDDSERFHLIGTAIHDPIDMVKHAGMFIRGMWHAEYEKRRS